MDVSNSQQVSSWANYILKRHRTPDLLINNASIVNQNAPLWKVNAQEFENVMNVNVNGVVNVIRAFVPAMITRKEERKIQNKEFSRDDVFIGNSSSTCSGIILRKAISSNN